MSFTHGVIQVCVCMGLICFGGYLTKHPLRNGLNTFGSLSLCQVYNYQDIITSTRLSR